MGLFGERIEGETPELHEEGVRMRFIGRREGVSTQLLERMDWAEETDRRQRRASRCSSPSTTAGARRSSTRRARYRAGARRTFRELLYAPEMHDPDLIIRTSGERRLSQLPAVAVAPTPSSYFRDELWPDFDREAFEARARRSTRARRRRFGGR